ncbi:MAG: hypothetical protein R8N50_00460 [Alphaproteobacteria bacterium]|nr:hypothetical protein [Alphaproteobacteria bacterium]
MQGSDSMLNLRTIFVGCLLTMVCVAGHAVELRGVADVNVTSDTAAIAKDMAFDEARRQIVIDVLRQYADVDVLETVVKGAENSELTELIAISSIEGERTSDTTYSASITMVLDADVARNWLDNKGVHHWLTDESNRDVFVVNASLSDKLADWAELNQIARNQNVDLDTKSISGWGVILELPVSARAGFTIAVRDAGWKYAGSEGLLRIWK